MQSFDRMVLDWARKQPADGTYDYEDHRGCAICAFLKYAGLTDEPRVSPFYWRDGIGGEPHRFSEAVEMAVRDWPWTYGAMADRLANALVSA